MDDPFSIFPPDWIDNDDEDQNNNNTTKDASPTVEESSTNKVPAQMKPSQRSKNPTESDVDAPNTSGGNTVSAVNKPSKSSKKAAAKVVTKKVTAKKTAKKKSASDSNEQVPEGEEPNQRSSTTMDFGDKMNPRYVSLEAKYCARWVHRKTGGDKEVPIKSLDDDMEILFVLAGAAGFARIRRHLLRFINKNRRQGWKLNELDFSDLPTEIPPFVAAHPVLIAETPMEEILPRPKNIRPRSKVASTEDPNSDPNDDDEDDASHPTPPVKGRTKKASSKAKKPSAKASAKTSAKPSSKPKAAKATKRSVPVDDPDDDISNYPDDDSHPDPPPTSADVPAIPLPPAGELEQGKGKASSSKSKASSKASSNPSKTQKTASVPDPTEEAYMELVRENLTMSDELDTIKIEKKAMVKMIMNPRLPNVKIQKLNLSRLYNMETPPINISSSPPSDFAMDVDIGDLINRIGGEEVLEDSNENNNEELLVHDDDDENLDIPKTRKRKVVTNIQDFLNEVAPDRDSSSAVTGNSYDGIDADDVGSLIMGGYDESDTDEDEDFSLKRVPKIELIRKRKVSGDGLSDIPHSYSTIPVAPMYYFHWAVKDEAPELYLKALYEPFNEKVHELLSLMIRDPHPPDTSVTASSNKSSDSDRLIIAETSSSSFEHLTPDSPPPDAVMLGGVVSGSTSKTPSQHEATPSASHQHLTPDSLPPAADKLGEVVAKLTSKPPPPPPRKAIPISGESARMLVLTQEAKSKSKKSTRKKQSSGLLPNIRVPRVSSRRSYSRPFKNISFRKEQEMLGRIRREQQKKREEEEEEEQNRQQKAQELSDLFSHDMSKLPKIKKV